MTVPARGPVGPARAVAFDVLMRVAARGAYADRALLAAARDLESRDRALATRLAYGTVQRQATLDHLIARLARRSPADLDAPVLAALRLGLYQLMFLESVPDHAAVDSSVELAKHRGARGGHTLVNAILRRAARAGGDLLAELGDATPSEAAIRHSHPEWIARLWWEQLGAESARALLAADNEPAETALRANALLTTGAALLSRLPVSGHLEEAWPDAVVVDGPFDAHGSPLWAEGLFMPQARAAMLPARALDPHPGERVLDLCAAPGAKTTHLAALMAGTGEIVAVERHAGRAAALERTCKRMHAHNVTVLLADAAAAQDAIPGSFDRVLVDPPCSGLGTLQARPDLRWRATESQVAELARLQERILASAATVTRPGGTLVYSTCTISPAENERQVERFLAASPGFRLDDLTERWHGLGHPRARGCLLTLPSRDDTAGFFVARLRRVR